MKNQNRNQQIEGLRGVAIILVVVYHLFCRFQQIYLDSDMLIVNQFGRVGVNFFLLISAYYVKCRTNNVRWMWEKVLRLWPTYFVGISITMIICTCYQLPHRTVTVRDYLLNILFLNGYLRTPYVDGAHWYLSVIISLYIIVFFFNIVSFKGKKLSDYCMSYTVWMGISVLFHIIDFSRGSALIGSLYVGIICVGISIRKIMKSETQALKNRWLIVLLLAIITEAVTSGIGKTIIFLISLPIFVLALFEKLDILNNKVLLYIGTISYPVYLIHQNIAYVIEYNLMMNSQGFRYIHSMIAFVIVFVIGGLLYYCVEKPIQTRIKLSMKRLL